MKTALVWGAAGGIGQAIVKDLIAEGWQTVGIAKDTENLPAGTDHIVEAYFDHPASVQRAVAALSQEIEQIDLWVYAAGDILSAKVEQMRAEDWNRIIAANLTGAFTTLHYSFPLLSEDAHIIFLGAVSERLQLPGFSAYAAAKVGLEAFATALAKEERKKRVTVVRPGAVDTPLWDKVPLKLPANAAAPEKIAQKILEASASGHKGKLDLV